MKFLLELVTCCGPCSSEAKQPAEETRLLVVAEPRRRVGRRRGRIGGGGREWKPSLTSISEENVLKAARKNSMERPKPGWRSSIKKKMPSVPTRRDRVSSNYGHHDYRRDPFSHIGPAFSPAPFMF